MTELQWTLVRLPPLELAGIQAQGASEHYLTGPRAGGEAFVCRWPIGAPTHLADMIGACRTYAVVTSPDEGRRLAQLFEDGEDVPELAWFQSCRPAPQTPEGGYEIDRLLAIPGRKSGEQAANLLAEQLAARILRPGDPDYPQDAEPVVLEERPARLGFPRLQEDEVLRFIGPPPRWPYQFGSLEEMAEACRRGGPREMFAAGLVTPDLTGHYKLWRRQPDGFLGVTTYWPESDEAGVSYERLFSDDYFRVAQGKMAELRRQAAEQAAEDHAAEVFEAGYEASQAVCSPEHCLNGVACYAPACYGKPGFGRADQ